MSDIDDRADHVVRVPRSAFRISGATQHRVFLKDPDPPDVRRNRWDPGWL
jgi:hypothetical protein